ncbi:helix-turn-helix domain-containing protein [Morganella morganii]|uniref:helix-turn-helix domain-containing protein n=1 Tax=Morganella morganii TaxID=582 RepID=UPI0021CE21D9|nr:helix-turn-helix transcriptional regulator [Morganella morganii]MCU6236733.1 helix-turn-helix domain-containing protein [Morganella morganii]
MKDNRIGDFLTAAILASGKPQSQIAEECGYSAHNNISMLKSGKMLFPVAKIPDFAKALNVDEGALFRIVMQTRYPEIFAMYTRNAEPITEDEKKVLEAYRKQKGGDDYDKSLAAIKADEFIKKATQG